MDDRLPEAGAGFVWDGTAGERSIPMLRPVVGGVVAAFTTRIGGVSLPPYDELNLSFRVGDDDQRARANREIAGRSIGRSGAWSVVRQVHGADIVSAQAPGRLATADGQWTDDPQRTLAVLGADCIPVLISRPGRVGVVHAGWRGLIAGVVERAVAAVGGRPLLFAGPSIGPCCYEVGADVARAFTSRFGASVITNGGRLDMWAATEEAARRANAADVHAARICTSCHPHLFFSHRRDRGRTGRQAVLTRLADG
jgi:purine-nucleoside/S-methyl-5'-thioadenosine phosphorylase / adenosine deaminase